MNFPKPNHMANKWIPPNLSLPTKHNRSVLLKWTCNVRPNYKKRQKITNSSSTGESGDRKALPAPLIFSSCGNWTQVRRERCNFLQRQSIQFSVSGGESGVIWLMSRVECSALIVTGKEYRPAHLSTRPYPYYHHLHASRVPSVLLSGFLHSSRRHLLHKSNSLHVRSLI